MRNFKKRCMLCLLPVLVLLFAACASEEKDTIARLESENAALQDEVDALKSQLGVSESLRLSEWDLTASVREDGQSADITLTATPVEYADGMEAELLAYLNGSKVASIECEWSGTAFIGTVGLSAADGYSYYCVLSDDTGKSEQVELSSPENLVKDTLVNLKTSMNAYCNIVLDEWSVEGDTLSILSCFVQVQLPRLKADSANIGFSGARLLLNRNGENLNSLVLELPEGEGEESFEATVTDAVFSVPELSAEDQLDLVLEATLSTGEVLTAVGGSWYLVDGTLTLIVG